MPMTPVYFGLEQGAHSDKVSNVAFDIFGNVDTAAVTVNG
jgi:hypothetical protein